MPATYAHYVFGKKVYKRLPSPVRQLIKENREAYLVGLHGPDLLFYYRPVGKNPINVLGGRMHHEIAAEFFEKGRRVYQNRPSYVLLSYLLGFICHYTLDSECHSYISCYMEEQGVSHSDIETDLDRELLTRDGKDPTRHNCTRHLIRDLDTEEAIASVLDVTQKQVDESIVGFHRTIRFFQCPGKQKAKLLQLLFRAAGKDGFIRGLLMTGEPHPKCRESREFLTERLEKAVDTAVQLICEYYEKINTQQELSERFGRDFE